VKIAIVNRHRLDVLGGSEIQCDAIATHLTQFGHECVYLAVGGGGRHYDVAYPVIPIRNPGFSELYRLLGELSPNVVYWRYNKNYLLQGALASKLARVRFVFAMSSLGDSRVWSYSGQAPMPALWAGEEGWHANPIAWARRLASHLVSSCRGALNYLAIPTLVDGVVSLNADYLRRIPVRAKATIRNSMDSTCADFIWPRPYVVWVSNIKEGKDPDAYLRLAGELQGSGVDFLMVGKVQQPRFEYLATSTNHPNNFHYLGPRTPAEVNGILRNSLFLVHTCYPEGFGNNFIQAWLQGKPTITLHFDPEGIIERENVGRFSRTFPRLVSDTSSLIDDEALRADMGARAQRIAHTLFDPIENARKLERFLLGVLE